MVWHRGDNSRNNHGMRQSWAHDNGCRIYQGRPDGAKDICYELHQPDGRVMLFKFLSAARNYGGGAVRDTSIEARVSALEKKVAELDNTTRWATRLRNLLGPS